MHFHALEWVESLLKRGHSVSWARTDADQKLEAHDLIFLSQPTPSVAESLIESQAASAASIPVFYKGRQIHSFDVQNSQSASINSKLVDRLRGVLFYGDLGFRMAGTLGVEELIKSLEAPLSTRSTQVGPVGVVPKASLIQSALECLQRKGLKILASDQCVLSFHPRSTTVNAIYNAPFVSEEFDLVFWASRTASMRVEGAHSQAAKSSNSAFRAQGAWFPIQKVSALPPIALEISDNAAGRLFLETGQWVSDSLNRLLCHTQKDKTWVQIETLFVDEPTDSPYLKLKEKDSKTTRPFTEVFPQLDEVGSKFKDLAPVDERILDTQPEARIQAATPKLRVIKTQSFPMTSESREGLLGRELT